MHPINDSYLFICFTFILVLINTICGLTKSRIYQKKTKKRREVGGNVRLFNSRLRTLRIHICQRSNK